MKSGIIVIDKPEGMTSHDVVGFVRRLTETKRVGHGGTLDPMATGVLPVFVGNATRVIEYMHEKDNPYAKKYRAEMRLGLVTDTQDITGSILAEMPETFDVTEISAEKTEAVLKSFEGEGEQSPPAYSAIKYKGKKLYEYARAGKDIPEDAVKKRKILIDSIELVNFSSDNMNVVFDVTCAGGLYVRSLCHDAGAMLGCGAVMSALRRLKSGPFTIEDSITPETAEKCPDLYMLSADTALSGLRKLVLDAQGSERFMNGIKIGGIDVVSDTETDFTAAVYNGSERSENFIGIGVYNGNVLKPRKVIV